MRSTVRRLALLAVCAAGFLPVTAAQAQWNGASRRPPPLYPHELQPGQSYAVEIAPGTYVIHRGSNQPVYPYASPPGRPVSPQRQATPAPARTQADRGLIEELRRRHARQADRKAAEQAAKAKQAAKRATRQREKPQDVGRRPDKVIHTKQIVREKPLVIETRRVVDDPPKVIERRYYADDIAAPPRRGVTGSVAGKRAGDDGDPRVIRADAEITILGPDRMSIRLLRKGEQAPDANARAGGTK